VRRVKRGARHDDAERRSEQDAAGAHQHQQQQLVVEHVVDVHERPGDLHRPRGPDALGEHAHVRAVDGGVVVMGAGAGSGDAPGGGVHRRPRGLAGRPPHGAGGRDELDVAGRLAEPRRAIAAGEQLVVVRPVAGGRRPSGPGVVVRERLGLVGQRLVDRGQERGLRARVAGHGHDHHGQRDRQAGHGADAGLQAHAWPLLAVQARPLEAA
jgi:hypothetical protein